MKIGLIGAEGTGRATQAKRLERNMTHRPGLTVSRLTRRQLMRLSEDERWKTLKGAFDEKLEIDSLFEHGVFEETLLDLCAQCFLHCWSRIDPSTAKAMLILTQENLRKYDLLFYFPLFDWSKDSDFPVRVTTDMILRGIMREIGIRPITLPDVGMEERTKFIRKHLELEEIAGGAPAKAEGGLILVP